jgi:hypothetical protein
VLARTARDTRDVQSASLRPSPVALLVPAGHRLAQTPTVRLADLDGERLLTWSARGTPFTDLLIDRLAAAGAQVEPVQSRITGRVNLPELSETGAVALVPAGWPPRSCPFAKYAGNVSRSSAAARVGAASPPSSSAAKARAASRSRSSTVASATSS